MKGNDPRSLCMKATGNELIDRSATALKKRLTEILENRLQ